MRLQKYLAQCGVASRRKSEELIKQGLVKVNGQIITDMGFKISTEANVEVDGRHIVPEDNKVYVMLNKPPGFVTTVNDQFGRTTVMESVKDINERIYPVGRLDYDTSGLLILTNDGEFAYKLTHPSHEVDKTYVAEVDGIPSIQEINRLEKGVEIDDYTTSPAKVNILEKKSKTSILKITIHEGKNRQVRKMCEAVGHTVLKLKRVSIGRLQLGDLKEGAWRKLTVSEIEMLLEEKIKL